MDPAVLAERPIRSKSDCRIDQGIAAGETAMSRTLVIVALGVLLPVAALAQKMPDPSKVAPEYREAAEKRRAEIIRQTACTNKAEKAKVLKRDMAAFINHCIDDAVKAEEAALHVQTK
jgi:hypothetical protein